MSVLSALAARHTALTDQQVRHLHRLLAEWQLLSDLAFADCLLMTTVVDRASVVVLGQVRPYPAQTLYQEDLVGTVLEIAQRPKVAAALAERRIVREGDPEWRSGTPVREEVVPVTWRGRPIAAVSVEQNLATARTPSHLELAYMRAAGDLQQMIADGSFPFDVEEEAEREVSPRVGDGFLHLDADLTVMYASPNAVSAYRRLGVAANIVGQRLDELGLDERAVVSAVRGGVPSESEIEANGAWVLRRFVPIIHGGRVTGALGLLRDVTELRRRDRMLLVKDATIREIHHRVKNNLQTVAALLRLQARRVGASDARAELEESVRRISSIALVHETLSQDPGERVEFDGVADRILRMVEASLTRPDRPVKLARRGSSGEISSDIATPLSLILVELVQNAMEHAFDERGGRVTVEMLRLDGALRVAVRDDGAGLPEGFRPTDANLGLQIVRTLVQDELAGTIEFTVDGGTTVIVTIPMRPV